MTDTTELEIRLKLSCLRGLLNHVPPTLRAVSVETKNKTILFNAVFDQNASENDIELLSIASTEVVADFTEFDLEETLKIIPFPKKIEHLKHLVYSRYEMPVSL